MSLELFDRNDWHGRCEGSASVVFPKDNCVALAKAILEWAALIGEKLAEAIASPEASRES